jgi:hypothetical protein
VIAQCCGGAGAVVLIRELQAAIHKESIDGAAAVRIDVNPQTSGALEPAVWTMMIVGLGAAGGMVRRARRRDGLTRIWPDSSLPFGTSGCAGFS